MNKAHCTHLGELFLVFTQPQETQKTIDIAAMSLSQTKEIIKILIDVTTSSELQVDTSTLKLSKLIITLYKLLYGRF